jgi:solute carrier family 10 (sodium/bile acid cotransporter), member 7
MLSSMLSSLGASLCRIRPDWLVLSLIGTVILATLLPCQGNVAIIFRALGVFAIASLFFLQGARLSRDAVLGGITHGVFTRRSPR